MNKTIKLRPKKGLTVLKPNGERLAAEGETVERASYWIRPKNERHVWPVSSRINRRSTPPANIGLWL